MAEKTRVKLLFKPRIDDVKVVVKVNDDWCVTHNFVGPEQTTVTFKAGNKAYALENYDSAKKTLSESYLKKIYR